MNQTSILDPVWLMGAAAHLVDVLGLGGWRSPGAGGRVAKVELALALQFTVRVGILPRLVISDQHLESALN